MNQKPVILITSIGRTGTEFFAKLFAHIVPDCTSLHEPDIVQWAGMDDKLEHLVQQIHRAGLWRMVFLKALGKWNLARLSDSRVVGNLSYAAAVTSLAQQRTDFAAKLPGAVYIESNFGYYGLLDVAPAVFRNHRALCIVRDGRDWVRSFMNWGEAYGKSGPRKFFAHKWPAACDIPTDPYKENWPRFTRFEKLCWAWSKLNGYALECISKNPGARLYQFENVFTGEQRYVHLKDLVTFATSLPGIAGQHLRSSDGWLERKIHGGSNEYPHWEQWTAEQKHQFGHLCGPLMERLGYRF